MSLLNQPIQTPEFTNDVLVPYVNPLPQQTGLFIIDSNKRNKSQPQNDFQIKSNHITTKIYAIGVKRAYVLQNIPNVNDWNRTIKFEYRGIVYEDALEEGFYNQETFAGGVEKVINELIGGPDKVDISPTEDFRFELQMQLDGGTIYPITFLDVFNPESKLPNIDLVTLMGFNRYRNIGITQEQSDLNSAVYYTRYLDFIINDVNAAGSRMQDYEIDGKANNILHRVYIDPWSRPSVIIDEPQSIKWIKMQNGNANMASFNLQIRDEWGNLAYLGNKNDALTQTILECVIYES